MHMDNIQPKYQTYSSYDKIKIIFVITKGFQVVVIELYSALCDSYCIVSRVFWVIAC